MMHLAPGQPSSGQGVCVRSRLQARYGSRVPLCKMLLSPVLSTLETQAGVPGVLRLPGLSVALTGLVLVSASPSGMPALKGRLLDLLLFGGHPYLRCYKADCFVVPPVREILVSPALSGAGNGAGSQGTLTQCLRGQFCCGKWTEEEKLFHVSCRRGLRQ